MTDDPRFSMTYNPLLDPDDPLQNEYQKAHDFLDRMKVLGALMGLAAVIYTAGVIHKYCTSDNKPETQIEVVDHNKPIRVLDDIRK